jgi:hypothetical protein
MFGHVDISQTTTLLTMLYAFSIIGKLLMNKGCTFTGIEMVSQCLDMYNARVI